jgi:hypothetical protein
MAKVIKPPNRFDLTNEYSVFLAGTIDMGQAEDWQKKVEQALADQDICILNPRRDDWDASWEQSIENPEFVEQVTWELSAQEHASFILFVFGSTDEAAKKAKAPITFLELGHFATKKDCMVCCPDPFYRKGNVDIFCKRYGIPLYENMEEMLTDFKALLAAEVSQSGKGEAVHEKEQQIIEGP